ncbi:protein RarD [Tsukamurella pulmonis]|uniref:Chloramphenicol-sensitive protein RarD n=1 Tax=Tsukamurella pulmonis TaxID=47312 RepID=A0A1H1HHP8_9ACTN|nr:EamA family transporter RarD [Tsukamurella pulmonis]RDH10873.1 EamA family transporter RarD [Tsukamurella pulmonis]BDD80854.1 protein RarD [Tsukamurella pulmonis]SDR24911.1 chloramphenicol-sensitive protein RarD [Tsukamurella pulmonis]SUP14568.1 putative chloramphenical resistance permease RarD [Tsukamurella pulmonis]
MAERDVSEVTRGTAMGVAAYLLWGLFPLYFDALKPTGAWEILAHRILWTLVLCGAALVILRDLAWIRPVLRQPRLLAGVAIAALLISTNWIVYIVAVTSGHTSDAALGYFLNPLVTVALGVVVLRERLRPLQWVAVGIGVLAFVYLAVVAGTFPVTALALAFSFGLYGLVKNKVGVHLNALQGLTLETAILAPIAAAVLVGIATWGGGLDFARHGAGHAALLAFAGVATAVPLLLFAAAARRIPLVTVGLIQFATPIMQLLCAVLFLGEHVSPERWIGFGIVWIALILLTVDTVVTLRRARAGRLAA